MRSEMGEVIHLPTNRFTGDRIDAANADRVGNYFTEHGISPGAVEAIKDNAITKIVAAMEDHYIDGPTQKFVDDYLRNRVQFDLWAYERRTDPSGMVPEIKAINGSFEFGQQVKVPIALVNENFEMIHNALERDPDEAEDVWYIALDRVFTASAAEVAIHMAMLKQGDYRVPNIGVTSWVHSLQEVLDAEAEQLRPDQQLDKATLAYYRQNILPRRLAAGFANMKLGETLLKFTSNEYRAEAAMGDFIAAKQYRIKQAIAREDLGREGEDLQYVLLRLADSHPASAEEIDEFFSFVRNAHDLDDIRQGRKPILSRLKRDK